jgi:hypothetical protein
MISLKSTTEKTWILLSIVFKIIQNEKFYNLFKKIRNFNNRNLFII